MNTMFFLQSGHVSTHCRSPSQNVLRWTLEDRSGEDRLQICSQYWSEAVLSGPIWRGYLIDFWGNPL